MVVIEIKTEREFVREHLLPHGVYRRELTAADRTRIWEMADRPDAPPETMLDRCSPASIRAMGGMIRRMRGLWEEPLPLGFPAAGEEARRVYATATGVFAASPTSASFVALVKAALPLLEEKG